VFAIDELWFFKESPQAASGVPTAAAAQAAPRGEREMIEAALAESRGRVAGLRPGPRQSWAFHPPLWTTDQSLDDR